MPDFRRRSTQTEMMDEADLGGAELERTLSQLEVVNTWLGGYGPSLRGIRQLVAREPTTDLTVLDVGTGAADTPRHMVRWARRHGLRLKITAIDLAPGIVEIATRRCAGMPEITARTQNLFDLPPVPQFDVVHAALVLHHMPDPVAALRQMLAVAKRGVVVNDLHRHPVAYHGIWLLTRLLSRDLMIRHDAPLSVLRGFSRHDLHQVCVAAGIPNPRITWHWAWRWLVVATK